MASDNHMEPDRDSNRELSTNCPAAREWTHRQALAIILAVVFVPRLIAITIAAAPARDAFRYFFAADIIERFPFPQSLAALSAQPVYPSLLLGLRVSLVELFGMHQPAAYLRAAQIIGIAASMLFHIAAYAVGCRLWDRRTALLGAVAVAILPRQVAYSIDVLADTLYAAFWMASIAVVVHDRPKRAIAASLIAGAFAGLAYLTRVEGLVLPAAYAGAWIISQAVASWRQSWREAGFRLAAFMLPCGLCVGTYVSTMGSISSKNSARALVGTPTIAETGRELNTANDDASSPQYHDAAPHSSISALQSLGVGLGRLVYEFIEETEGWLSLLAVAALFGVGRRCRWPDALVPLAAFLLVCLLLVALRIRAGFLSGRYLMPLLPLVAMFAMSRLDWIADRLSRAEKWMARRLFVREDRFLKQLMAPKFAIAAVASAACIPLWLVPLHHERRPHMEAAEWLRQHTNSATTVFDPTLYSAYFAGRDMWVPSSDASEIDADYAAIDLSALSRLAPPAAAAAARIQSEARLIAAFPHPSDDFNRRVCVYAVQKQSNSAIETNSGPLPEIAERPGVRPLTH